MNDRHLVSAPNWEHRKNKAISLDKRTKISRKKKPIWVHSPWGHLCSMFSGNVPSTSSKNNTKRQKELMIFHQVAHEIISPIHLYIYKIFISINFVFFFARHKNVTKHLNRSRAICDSTTITKQENKCCNDLSQKISLLLATCLYFAYMLYSVVMDGLV